MYNEKVAMFLLLGSFVVFIVLRMPVIFAIAVSSCITLFYINIPLMSFIQQMGKGVDSFSLMAIPFFVLAGEIMGAGGIATDFYRLPMPL